MKLASPRIFFLAAIAPLFIGCSTTISYYTQAIKGHVDIITRARPVAEVVEDENQSPALRDRLRLAQESRSFVSAALSLPDNDSYRRYADIERPYVVWNVVATAELDVSPKRWCFLWLGCLSYRGYFSREDADKYAETLRREGYDVYVAGAQAYSTLGWFNDPLLNTFINRSEADLVALMAHELAHQQLYIRGDTAFNEAFAVTVAREGVKRWFAERGRSEEYARYLEHEQRQSDFHTLLLAVRKRLGQIYADTQLSAQQKRAAKHGVFAELRQDYEKLKERWGGYSGYDRWMSQPLNNAHLALMATYQEFVPAFAVLLEQEGDEMQRFFARARELGGLPAGERQIQLQALLEIYRGRQLAKEDSLQSAPSSLPEEKSSDDIVPQSVSTPGRPDENGLLRPPAT